MRTLTELRDPKNEKLIKTHLDKIQEIQLAEGLNVFRIGMNEFDTLNKALASIIQELNEDIDALDRRPVDRNLFAMRTRDEMRILVNAVVKEIEGDFLEKLKNIFSEDSVFKKKSLSGHAWTRERDEKEAADALKDCFIKATGNEFHFLMLVKNRPEILNESLDI